MVATIRRGRSIVATRPDPHAIRKFILDNLSDHEADIVRVTAEAFKVSRQSAHYHVAKLVGEGLIEVRGRTKNRRYTLKTEVTIKYLPLATHGDEDLVWRTYADRPLNGLPENVSIICYHGFTEMFNNAIDHSEGSTATIVIERNARKVTVRIGDNGIGIFEKIRSRFGLEDQRQAILELSKGKLTTDPKRHTGEGIYFTSRMFDEFSILSGKLFLIHYASKGDWLIEDHVEDKQGTWIRMAIAADSPRTVQETYDQHISETAEEEFAFSRTHVPLALAVYGNENLISRSQAKRVLRRFDRFKEVMLDFAGIDSVGQAFADEIFRVFYLQNPHIGIITVNTNPQIDRMIRRAIASRDEKPRSPADT
jgi:anti-sigma regulatory factor (Ser/Thr protein kinase)/DNA-binding transcriptional ArsR family regulator